ncbi:coiled-coil domain-containing protein 201 isoform X2 [Manis javanica]|uniref:coiled-coil domain-containing protein 201 isoform X2 n=1 Tax=Manis javanica TaxID=9974 RepID=UPI003C6D9A9B
METGAQISGLSASEDEGPLSETSPLPLRRVLQHSTLEEAALSEHRQSLGCVPSPLPACASWDLPSQQPGLSPKAALQEGQPSNIWASGASSGLVGPDRDPWAPEEDMPTPASGAWPQQQGKSARAGRWPRNLGLPGIPSVAGRRRRDLKKLAAAMERVRQWEAWLLQSIEEATQHELTIQDC